MPIRQETLTYEADGLTMASEFFVDDATAGPRPTILIFPDAMGFGDHILRNAKRLAGLGFAALACDLHGGAKRYGDIPEVMPLIGPLRDAPERTRARAGGALNAVLAHPRVDKSRVAAIGYCFGGVMALELARSGAPVAAVVGFHSGLATVRPQDATNIKGKVLVCIGADDPVISPEERLAFEQEMRAGGVDWRMHLYGGVVHSFTQVEADSFNRLDTARYSAGADARSWTEMLALFAEVF